MVTGMSESSLWGGDPKMLLPWWHHKRYPLCRKGVVVLQVQNSSHAWRELSCSERSETSQNPPPPPANEERSDVCSSEEISGDGSSSGSTSESDNGDDSELVPSVPETPLQKPVATAPQKNPPNTSTQTKPLNGNPAVNQKSDVSKSRTTESKNKSLRTLRYFEFELSYYRDDANSLLKFLAAAKVKGGQKYLAKLLTWAAELVHQGQKGTFLKTLSIYTRRYTLDCDIKPGPTPAEFDDYLYGLTSESGLILHSFMTLLQYMIIIRVESANIYLFNGFLPKVLFTS